MSHSCGYLQVECAWRAMAGGQLLCRRLALAVLCRRAPGRRVSVPVLLICARMLVWCSYQVVIHSYQFSLCFCCCKFMPHRNAGCHCKGYDFWNNTVSSVLLLSCPLCCIRRSELHCHNRSKVWQYLNLQSRSLLLRISKRHFAPAAFPYSKWNSLKIQMQPKQSKFLEFLSPQGSRFHMKKKPMLEKRDFTLYGLINFNQYRNKSNVMIFSCL